MEHNELTVKNIWESMPNTPVDFVKKVRECMYNYVYETCALISEAHSFTASTFITEKRKVIVDHYSFTIEGTTYNLVSMGSGYGFMCYGIETKEGEYCENEGLESVPLHDNKTDVQFLCLYPNGHEKLVNDKVIFANAPCTKYMGEVFDNEELQAFYEDAVCGWDPNYDIYEDQRSEKV